MTEELEEKIRKMNLDELLDYYRAAKTTNKVLNVFGIGVILITLIFLNIFTVVSGAFLVLIMAKIGEGLGETINYIEDRIIKLSGK